MKHNIRISGKFATKQQRADNEARKYKDLAEYYFSILTGHYRIVRHLTEENQMLRKQLASIKAPQAAIKAHHGDLTPQMYKCINYDYLF